MAYTATATATFNRDTIVYGDLRIGNNPVTPTYIYEYDIFISFNYASASTVSTTQALTTATAAVSFTIYSYHDNGYTTGSNTTATLAAIKTILDKALYYYDNQKGSLILPASGGYRYQYHGPTTGIINYKHQYITCKAAYIEYDGTNITIHGSGVEDYETSLKSEVVVRPQASLNITSEMLTNAGSYSYNYSYIRKRKLTNIK